MATLGKIMEGGSKYEKLIERIRAKKVEGKATRKGLTENAKILEYISRYQSVKQSED